MGAIRRRTGMFARATAAAVLLRAASAAPHFLCVLSRKTPQAGRPSRRPGGDGCCQQAHPPPPPTNAPAKSMPHTAPCAGSFPLPRGMVPLPPHTGARALKGPSPPQKSLPSARSLKYPPCPALVRPGASFLILFPRPVLRHRRH